MDNTNELLHKFLEQQLHQPQDSDKTTNAKRKRPYYSATHAFEAKKIIDKLINDKASLRMLTQGRSVNTMRIMYYDGLSYLLDHLDPDKVYCKAADLISCSTRRDELIFSFKNTTVLSDLPVAPMIEWRKPVAEFLDTRPEIGKKYHNTQVLLNKEDIDWLQQQMAGIEELFMHRFSDREILIIRFDNPKEQQ